MSKNNRGYNGLKQCLNITSEFLSDSNRKKLFFFFLPPLLHFSFVSCSDDDQEFSPVNLKQLYAVCDQAEALLSTASDVYYPQEQIDALAGAVTIESSIPAATLSKLGVTYPQSTAIDAVHAPYAPNHGVINVAPKRANINVAPKAKSEVVNIALR